MTGAEARAPGRSTDIEKQIGADNVAAIIIEPIQGEGGFIVPAPGLPARARRVCAGNGMCSSPTRSSPASAVPAMFACEHEGIVPDLITTAKGIAGGLPLAAVHRPGRDHGRRRTSAVSAAPTAATRSPAPRRSAAIETIERDGLRDRGPAHRES